MSKPPAPSPPLPSRLLLPLTLKRGETDRQTEARLASITQMLPVALPQRLSGRLGKNHLGLSLWLPIRRPTAKFDTKGRPPIRRNGPL